MATLIAALVGLLLGSLLSVLVGRWPQWRGVAMGRSECPDCHHPLAWFDLVFLVILLDSMLVAYYVPARMNRLHQKIYTPAYKNKIIEFVNAHPFPPIKNPDLVQRFITQLVSNSG